MKKTKKRQQALFSHHSTTGKRLPREYTAYPLLIFVLLLIGVLMAGLTFSAQASNVSVSAYVDGPPPTLPATVTSPTADTRYTAVPETVSGTCDPGFIVKLYRNNVFSGAVFCQADGTFSLQTDLFNGANTLQARIFNALEAEGPASPPVTVYYDKPIVLPPPPSNPGETPVQTPTETPANSESPASAVIPKMTLTAENLYKGYFTGDTVEWPLEIHGGTAPYAFTVDWGDGTSTTLSRKDEGAFTVKHVYTKAGGYKGSYAIKIVGSDSNQDSTFLQLAVIIRDHSKGSNAIPGIASTTEPPIHIPMHYIWPTYGVTLLMVSSFWLGQWQGLGRLKALRHLRHVKRA